MKQFNHFLTSTAGRIVVTIVSAALIFGLILLAAKIEFMPLVFAVFAVCTYFGWKALTFITPRIFLVLPAVGWIIYGLIKGILAFFIGCFVAPFQIGAKVSKAGAVTFLLARRTSKIVVLSSDLPCQLPVYAFLFAPNLIERRQLLLQLRHTMLY